jgi:hypothetical protein
MVFLLGLGWATTETPGEEKKLTDGLRERAAETRETKCRDHVRALAHDVFLRLTAVAEEGFEGLTMPFPLNQSRCRGRVDVLKGLAKELCGNTSLSVFVTCKTPPPLVDDMEEDEPPVETRMWPIQVGLQPEAKEKHIDCDCKLAPLV